MKTIEEVQAYAEKVIPFLGLSHWEIKFIETEKNDDEQIAAENFSIYFYASSHIEIRKYFFTLEEEKQKIVIIHELLHSHFSFWEELFKTNFEEHPDYASNRMIHFGNTLRSLSETPVELLARSLYTLIESYDGQK